MTDASKLEPPQVEWTPEMVARFWDYEVTRPHNFFAYQVGGAVIARMRRYLPVGARVLDYGAGTGYLLEDLMAAGYRCGGIEHGAGAVAALKSKLAGEELLLGIWHVDETDKLAARFDAAFLTEVVEHLYDRDLNASLDKIHALLVPGGRLIITTPNEEELSQNMIMSPESGRLFHRWQHVRSWSAATLSAHVRACGYEIVVAGATDFLISPAAGRRLRPLWQRAGIAIARRAAGALVPEWKPPHLFLVAEKPKRP